MSMPDDLPAIRAALVERLESLAEVTLGLPGQRSPRKWRWGAKGSLALEMSGPKRGTWFDHEAAKGGGPLDLIMLAHASPIADAIAWARTWTGAVPDARAEDRSTWRQEAEAREAEARRGAINNAQWLARLAKPAADTPGEVYLSKVRAIPKPAAGWPPSVRWFPGAPSGGTPDMLRWHARHPGLLFIATDDAGAIHAAQHIRLTPDGRKADDGRLVKITVGAGRGAAVRFPARPFLAAAGLAEPLILAEGPETGLSAWAATGRETWVALGSVTRAEPPPGRTLIVCRDDDALPGVVARLAAEERAQGDEAAARRLEGKLAGRRAADAKLAEAVERWRAAGSLVAIATPWRTRKGDSSDMNDAMRAHGAAWVADRIARATRTVEPAAVAAAEGGDNAGW